MKRRVEATQKTTFSRWALAVLACAIFVLPAARSDLAHAKRPFTPPKDKIWHGVSDTGRVPDFKRFNRQVRSHNALNMVFYYWGVPLSGALDRWKKMDARGVLSLSTAPGGGSEVISPREISRGRDDEYPLDLWRAIRNSRQVVYVRPHGEMNNFHNPYCAFNGNGSRRGRAYSTHAFRRRGAGWPSY